jgi:hypothetical protein
MKFRGLQNFKVNSDDLVETMIVFGSSKVQNFSVCKSIYCLNVSVRDCDCI